MDPSKRLTCTQALAHPYLADLTLKDAQQRQPQQQPAAAMLPAASSLHSNASTATQINDLAYTAAAGPCSSEVCSPLSLPPAVSTSSRAQRQQAQQQQPLPPSVKPPTVNINQAQQQPTGKVNLQAAGSGQQQVTPRLSLPHPEMLAAASGIGSSKHQPAASKLTTPRAPQAPAGAKKPAAKKAAAGKAAAAVSGSVVPRLQLGATNHNSSKHSKNNSIGGQLQLEITPRSGRGAAAAAAAALAVPPPSVGGPAANTRSKGAAAAVGAASPAATSGMTSSYSAAAVAAAAAAATDSSDQDMTDADGPLTARRRKRLASGGCLGGTSLRGGGRRDVDEMHAAVQCQQQQQPYMSAAPPGSRMDVDSSRPQSPARQAGVLQSSTGMLAEFMNSAASGTSSNSDLCLRVSKRPGQQQQQQLQQSGQAQQQGQGLTLPAVLGSNPLWRDGGRDAAGAAAGPGPTTLYHQQQHFAHSKPPVATGPGGKWGSTPGCTAAGLCSLGSSMPGNLVGRGSVTGFGAGAMSWEDAAGSGASMQCSFPPAVPGLTSTRASLASSFSTFDDVLAGLHAAPVVGMAPTASSFAGYHAKPGVAAAGAGGQQVAAAGLTMGAAAAGQYGHAAGRYGGHGSTNINSTNMERTNSSGLPAAAGILGPGGYGVNGMQHTYGQQQQGYHQHHHQ